MTQGAIGKIIYQRDVNVCPNANIRGVHDPVTGTESCVEHSEMTDFAHFDNETAIAAIEEISDGEQKQEIASVIEVISNHDVKFAEHERYCYRVRKGRRKRHWSHEWQNVCRGSASLSVDTSLNNSMATVLHRKPKKRLFAHR